MQCRLCLTEVKRVTLEELDTFIHAKFCQKYKHQLEALNLSFYTAMKLLKGILMKLESLLELVAGDKNSTLLLQNCISLVSRFFTDSSPVSLAFCQEFIDMIPGFIESFVLYFHQVSHIDAASRSTERKIKQLFREVEPGLLVQLASSFNEIQEQMERAQPILSHIQSMQEGVKTQAATFERALLNPVVNSGFEDYMKAFNDCYKAVHKDGERNEKGDLVKKMIGLVKESCMQQLYLETLLDLPCKVAHILLKSRQQPVELNLGTFPKTTFNRMLPAMEKPETIRNALASQEVDLREFVDMVRVLLSQHSLVAQARAVKNIMSVGDKYIFLTDEFYNTYFAWKNSLMEISQLDKKPQYLRELEQMKHFYFVDQNSNSIGELSKFTRKLFEYQQKIIGHHSMVQAFNHFRQQIQEMCLMNFGVVVELVLGQPKPPLPANA